MDIYTRKRTWKFWLFVFAIIIGISSLFVTNSLVDSLAYEEKKKIEIWALNNNFNEIILGTSEIQKDAVRFWAASGFKLIKKEKLQDTEFFGLSFKKQIHASELLD